jgi:hypothetical protein
VSSEVILPGRPWRPGESGNPGGRPKGIRAFRERFREHQEEYWACLHNLATTSNRQQLEALRLLYAYGLGPPNALTPGEGSSELEKLGLDELRARLRHLLINNDALGPEEREAVRVLWARGSSGH